MSPGWRMSACCRRKNSLWGGLFQVFRQARASPLTCAMCKSGNAGSGKAWRSFRGDFQGKCSGASFSPLPSYSLGRSASLNCGVTDQNNQRPHIDLNFGPSFQHSVSTSVSSKLSSVVQCAVTSQWSPVSASSSFLTYSHPEFAHLMCKAR